MTDLANHQWLIIGGIALVILYLKGYVKIPQLILDRLGVPVQPALQCRRSGDPPNRRAGDPVILPETDDPIIPKDPVGIEKLGTHRLAQLLAKAAISEAHNVVAYKKAMAMRDKIVEELSAPFSEGGDPSKPLPK